MIITLIGKNKVLINGFVLVFMTYMIYVDDFHSLTCAVSYVAAKQDTKKIMWIIMFDEYTVLTQSVKLVN